MNPAKQLEDGVFYEAINMADLAERKAFLDHACEGNAKLRAIVERKLAVHGDAENFFATGRSTFSLLRENLPKALPEDGESKLDERIGTRIGPYKLLQWLGQGGCGVVHMAEQEEPVRRRVALKLIKLGMDTKNVIARFNAERQALAMMDHPNIARVLDAGATDSGQPYFVMELVRGVKITEYCDRNSLDTIQRLHLFIQICHAIQHAHQKGVIHRDIKPSNILVTMHNGAPMPKVIDFGIAKAIQGKLTEQTLFTAYEQVIGTPAYMSPEQAQMSNLDVDTRSDIYSLGVLLYELLTGKTPFDAKTLMESGLDQMRQTLREKEPQRPSMILTTFREAELKTTAEKRHLEPVRLISMLKGDLDWIVMKALEKDRTRRYETANGLLMDVQRYLNSEPVVARPPSQLYRLKKLVLRNKAIFISGAIVGLTSIMGFGTSTWLFIKERDARHEEARLLLQTEMANKRETELRQQAEDREKITQAAIYVSQGKFAEADKSLDALKALPMRPSFDGVAAFRKVANWLAVQGRWAEATDRFSELMKIDELDDWGIVTWDYQSCSTVLAESGDAGHYTSFCKASVARFNTTTNGNAAWRILGSSLLMPADKELLASLEPLASVSEKTFKQMPDNTSGAVWGAIPIALWKYRNSDYQAAIQYCQYALASEGKKNVRDADAHMILAMAYFQAGRLEEARSELNNGREVIENKFKAGLDQGNSLQGFWWDWLNAHVLLREATALIEGEPWSMESNNFGQDSN